jgi:Icc-related predicted phosphoesterase
MNPRSIDVVHVSDMHGKLRLLDAFLDGAESQPDLFILTGDILPNFSEADRQTEEELQPAWVKGTADHFRNIFKDTPVLFQRGNHEFCWPDEIWNEHGINVFRVMRTCQTIFGLTFAGFSEINFIEGRWPGEIRNPEMTAIVDEVIGNNPDILITHAPPGGIMDGVHNSYGVVPLASQLFYRPNTIRYHLFGHTHACRGTIEQGGILFSNAATGFNRFTMNPKEIP